MRVAAVQFKPDRSDGPGSLRRLVRLASRAAIGRDLVVLPEMAVTGYAFRDADEVRKVAEPARGATLQALSAVAAAAGTWLVVGFPEAAGPRLYNSALVIDRDGVLRFVYRKTMLFEADECWSSPGDSGYAAFDTGAGRFGVGICMDLNDDRFVAWCAGASLRAIAFPTNWVQDEIDAWAYWVWRLRGVDAALVAANTYGDDRDIRFSGRSAVVQGRSVLAAAPVVGDAVLRVDLGPGQVEAAG